MEVRSNGKIIEVEYGPDEPMDVPRQQEVKAELEKAIREHPVGLLIHVPTSLRQIDLNVATFWAGGLRELTPGLKALAAITSSRPVRLFAETFSKTLTFIGAPIPIKVFATADEARAWLQQVV